MSQPLSIMLFLRCALGANVADVAPDELQERLRLHDMFSGNVDPNGTQGALGILAGKGKVPAMLRVNREARNVFTFEHNRRFHDGDFTPGDLDELAPVAIGEPLEAFVADHDFAVIGDA